VHMERLEEKPAKLGAARAVGAQCSGARLPALRDDLTGAPRKVDTGMIDEDARERLRKVRPRHGGVHAPF